MEEVKKEEEINVGVGKIDVDVLDAMKQEDVLEAISDDKQLKRLMLNFFCEFLSEIKDLRKDFDEYMQFISVCSADKMANFYKELEKNVKDEKNRIEVQENMKKSHLKSKKTKKVITFPKKVVK